MLEGKNKLGGEYSRKWGWGYWYERDKEAEESLLT
jgi:hypothetical protein